MLNPFLIKTNGKRSRDDELDHKVKEWRYAGRVGVSMEELTQQAEPTADILNFIDTEFEHELSREVVKKIAALFATYELHTLNQIKDSLNTHTIDNWKTTLKPWLYDSRGEINLFATYILLMVYWARKEEPAKESRDRFIFDRYIRGQFPVVKFLIRWGCFSADDAKEIAEKLKVKSFTDLLWVGDYDMDVLTSQKTRTDLKKMILLFEDELRKRAEEEEE